MSVQHGVTIGDPPGSLGSASWDAPKTCNCACQRCMDGGCCMWPSDREVAWPTMTTTTVVSTGTAVWTCGATDHDFEILDPARLYCRKCGTTRTV